MYIRYINNKRVHNVKQQQVELVSRREIQFDIVYRYGVENDKQSKETDGEEKAINKERLKTQPIRFNKRFVLPI